MGRQAGPRDSARHEGELFVGRTGQLQAAQAFIESKLEWRGLSPTSTARALGISVRLLHMVFKPTGVTFSRYVLTRRLERARLQLAEPGRKVLDVAYSCGIESSTFYRAFRNAYGSTPTGYRQSLREQSLPVQDGDPVPFGESAQLG